MQISNQWNWDNVDCNYWKEPANDVYYFLDRWKQLNLIHFLDLGCGIGKDYR